MNTPAPDRSLSYISFGLGGVLLLTAVSLFAVTRYLSQHAEAVKTWPVVDAVLTDIGFSRYRPPGETQDRQRIITTFRYLVAGAPHEFFRSQEAGWASDGYTGPMPYSQGQVMRVSYDPLAPGTHAQPGDGVAPWAVLLGAVLCVVISLPFFAFGARRLKREAAAA